MSEASLYIFWFLHQTTTWTVLTAIQRCCISFDSYIKPQPSVDDGSRVSVVYLLIPTSNHNSGLNFEVEDELYIFWFLHQTTTLSASALILCSCISFDSYIKPQLWMRYVAEVHVVYLLIPTSNHNPEEDFEMQMFVVYLLIPTSNHNCCILHDTF